MCTWELRLPALKGRINPWDPFPGVRSPNTVWEAEFLEFLLEENMPPGSKKDIMEGSDTTLIATAISTMERTSTHA
jgi:hypothetical protein